MELKQKIDILEFGQAQWRKKEKSNLEETKKIKDKLNKVLRSLKGTMGIADEENEAY